MGCLISRKSVEKVSVEKVSVEKVSVEKELSYDKSVTFIKCQHCKNTIPKKEFINYYGFCKECRKKL
jgi:hypothetical protein